MSASLATRISAAVVSLYALVLLAFVGPQQGWPGTGGRPERQTDYVAIYAGGRMALDGRAAEAYDWQRHREAQSEVLGEPARAQLRWYYPPTFLLIAAPLAALPYGASMMAWVLLMWGAYGAAARQVLGHWQGALWMSVPVAGVLNAMVGNNGMLSAAVLGFGLAFLPTRPILAGLCLGALSYKPHLGLLIPIALAVAGMWPAFWSAALATVGLAGLSMLVFGTAAWTEFLPSLANASAAAAAMAAPEKLQSAFGMARSIGLDASTAYALQISSALAAAAAVASIWRSPRIGYDLKAAMLAAAALLVSPYLYVYDLAVLTLAQAFLYRAALPDGLDATEIGGLIAANILVLAFAATGVPLGLAATLIVATLVVRRANPAMLASKCLPAAVPPRFKSSQPA